VESGLFPQRATAGRPRRHRHHLSTYRGEPRTMPDAKQSNILFIMADDIG
jgi:hypothetical protein